MVYELFLYHLIKDDKELDEIYRKCKSGEQMCGMCKKRAAELMELFLKQLNEKREDAKEKLKDYLSL